ncbi:MAG: GNAT family N-acetyltransferase [Bryobacteraceae bacterium]
MAAIRLLTPPDLPALLHLSRSASWNQTADDWLRLLFLQPDGCFGVELNGTLAATATVVCYPPNLAWLGMVLTLPEYRGRGMARSLAEHAITYSGRRTLRLDASDMGKPLYESLGFVDECPVERWLRDPAPFPAVGGEHPFAYPQALDVEAFGADRSALVHQLAEAECAALPDASFALGRSGANARYFGPCVCFEPDSARKLVEWFLARHPGEPVFWDLFPHHVHASRLAAEFGFRPVRRLSRMSLPAAARSLPDQRIYAIAGFEYG